MEGYASAWLAHPRFLRGIHRSNLASIHFIIFTLHFYILLRTPILFCIFPPSTSSGASIWKQCRHSVSSLLVLCFLLKPRRLSMVLSESFLIRNTHIQSFSNILLTSPACFEKSFLYDSEYFSVRSVSTCSISL